MTFPNGFHGVKKLFTAELLNLISAVLLIIAGIVGLGSFAASMASGSDASFAAFGGATIIVLVSTILVIIALIMKIVGLNQAGKDEELFRTAFLIIIFSLVLTVVSAILGAIFSPNSFIDDIVRFVGDLANIFVIFLCVAGVQRFAVALRNDKLIRRGNTLAWIIASPYILSAIARLVFGIFGANNTTATIGGIMGLIAGILSLIGSIMFLTYLGAGKNMLKNN